MWLVGPSRLGPHHGPGCDGEQRPADRPASLVGRAQVGHDVAAHHHRGVARAEQQVAREQSGQGAETCSKEDEAGTEGTREVSRDQSGHTARAAHDGGSRWRAEPGTQHEGAEGGHRDGVVAGDRDRQQAARRPTGGETQRGGRLRDEDGAWRRHGAPWVRWGDWQSRPRPYGRPR
jgi:hypothetical protein